ncbi:IS630 family transposase [Oceanisphaera arctica]|uniref:IS630 family transposase n=1 Tax=Oceanisphaera arctica TaxID=641510 RepID=UPI000CEB8B60|nr:IS630 family transposase [Oceanisphaera arctica]GHA09875.1 hypothetical protein GCM10007082_08660 [Oceanisphaera arctica]
MAGYREVAKARKIELFYCDESGFSCIPNVQRAWSPLGVTHLADASVGRKRVNVIGALDYATGALHFELFEHSVKRQHVVPFLDKLAQSSCQDKVTIVVMDNASIHHFIDPAMRDKWLYEYLFVLLYLPPYSPELNLIEILWKQAKYHWRSLISWSKDKLVNEVSTLLKGVGSDFHISYA